MQKQTAILLFVAMQIFLMRSITNLSIINTAEINKQIGKNIPIAEIAFALSTFISAYGKIFGHQLLQYLPFDLIIILIFLLYFFVLIGFLQQHWILYIISKISHGFISGVLIYFTIALLDKYNIAQGFIVRSTFHIILPNIIPIISLLFTNQQLIISILIINLLAIVICSVALNNIVLKTKYNNSFQLIKLSKQYPMTVIYGMLIGIIFSGANWYNWTIIKFIQQFGFNTLTAKSLYSVYVIMIGFVNLLFRIQKVHYGYFLIAIGYIMHIIIIYVFMRHPGPKIFIALYLIKNFIIYTGSLVLLNFFAKQKDDHNYQVCILFEIIRAIASAIVYFLCSVLKYNNPIHLIIWSSCILFIIQKIHTEQQLLII